MTLTELEAMRDARGYELRVFTANDTEFRCRYRPEDIPSMYEAVKNNMREHATHYFVIEIVPIEKEDWPRKPLSMDEWAALGHTLD